MGWINRTQLDRDHDGQRGICAADGRPGTAADPIVKASDGFRIHESHTTNPNSGYYGQKQEG